MSSIIELKVLFTLQKQAPTSTVAEINAGADFFYSDVMNDLLQFIANNHSKRDPNTGLYL